ncbi:unnamed protein product [Pleuronectes platessa]|uniref:Uncharacterized protein n=1 Tax=Pleuronectes platessa TaxID=8262 RepID=A0A9N7UCN0_PLEPL|nr:unnamed protein product [Pleuronectes platessa]
MGFRPSAHRVESLAAGQECVSQIPDSSPSFSGQLVSRACGKEGCVVESPGVGQGLMSCSDRAAPPFCASAGDVSGPAHCRGPQYHPADSVDNL